VTEHVHHVTAELRQRGHDVTVITAHFPGHHARESRVIRIGRNVLVPINGAWVNLTVGARLQQQLHTIFDRLKPDIIHTHCPLAPTLPLIALKAAAPQTRVVGTFHAAASNSAGYRLFNRALRSYWRRIDVRIAVSAAALELAHSYFPGEYVTVPNGVDTRRFSPHTKPIERFKDDAFNILFVGRLDKRKGLKYLFKAVTTAARVVDRRLRVIVVGDDGLRRHALPRMPAGVEVVFAGVVANKELPRYFASGDVFCSPATGQESFGIVLLEAMASGVPVIGTGIPGYLTILRDEWNSLVVPPRDADTLADAIVRLTRDESLRWRIRSNGLDFSRQYRWSHVVDRLEAIYRGSDEDSSWESVVGGPLRTQKA
jgi:phosphatidylinositol alpha-mannosyltransferase